MFLTDEQRDALVAELLELTDVADRDALVAELAERMAETEAPPRPRPVPAHVERWCLEYEISSSKVRWCDVCGVVAFAVDHHQISFLDSVGFDTWCPDCKCPPGPG